jgi:branched-chain amino acid transport system permease protein
MGANPVRIKQFAFGIATAVLGIAGALLIIVAPVEPTLDRAYIGRTSASSSWPGSAASAAR